jgi:hypothetical protein
MFPYPTSSIKLVKKTSFTIKATFNNILMMRKATNENIKVWFRFSCDSKLHYYSKNVSSNNNPTMTMPNKYLGENIQRSLQV